MRSEMKIGVLMGGLSAEREVSLMTGQAVLNSLKKQKFNVIGVDIGANPAQQIKATGVEAAFLALHGRYGEDGTIQGILEFLKIPYTHSNVLASAIAMNKAMTKRLISYLGIRTPDFQVLKKKDWISGGRQLWTSRFGTNGWKKLNDVEIPNSAVPQMDPPVVVKPVNEGSTIGVSIVDKAQHIGKALDTAFQYDDEVLLEAFIPGKEATIGVLCGEALPSIEIVPVGGFYDFNAKYQSGGTTQYICPARIDKELEEILQKDALNIHNFLGCSGTTRSDFRITPDGEAYFLEINTIPGMTATSLIPKAAAATGISFDAVVYRLLEEAVQKRFPNDVKKNDGEENVNLISLSA